MNTKTFSYLFSEFESKICATVGNFIDKTELEENAF